MTFEDNLGLAVAVMAVARQRGLLPDEPHPSEDDEREQWRRRAACAGVLRLWLFGLPAVIPVPIDLFFPEQGDDATVARRICAGCGVREECLASALANHEEFGVWGGAGGNVRRIFSALATAGNWSGYQLAITRHFARLDELAVTSVRPAGAQVSYGAGARCGTAAKYGRGCRCEPCRTAKREHERAAKERRREEQAS